MTTHAALTRYSMCLVDLDTGNVRDHMVEEIERDIQDGALYQGKFLSEIGASRYPQLLMEAARFGTAETLTQGLNANRKSGPLEVAVPRTAAMTLAEGEFNRFYIRGLALEAADASISHLEVYRAKAVTQPRSRSEGLIGERVSADDILLDLRLNHEVTFHGVPAGPNSGLSLRFPGSHDRRPAADAS